MLKTISLLFLLVTFNGVSVKSNPLDSKIIENPEKSLNTSPWLAHLKDFLDLVDIDQTMEVVMIYIYDPEVIKFLELVFSPKFKKIIWEFESMSEFKEVLAYLTDKGYDVYGVLNMINAALQLPPFEPTDLIRSEKGISGLFEDLIEVLPLEEMKKLFEEKLQNDKEIADLFETINSEEFLDILRRMSRNPTFIEIKMIFEAYGFDFKLLCNLAKEILADYYQGIFCYE